MEDKTKKESSLTRSYRYKDPAGADAYLDKLAQGMVDGLNKHTKEEDDKGIGMVKEEKE